MLPDPARRWLSTAARHAVAQRLAERGTPAPAAAPEPGPLPEEPLLTAPARLFVSWHLRGELLGCIGTLQPWPSLAEGVTHYAVLAALEDRRTPDLDARDFGALELEISVLGEPQMLDAVGLDAIGRLLVPHRDGVILSHEVGSAFFLPVVWEKLPVPELFLASLCRKAGLDPRWDGPQCRAQVLQAYAFSDPAPSSSA